MPLHPQLQSLAQCPLCQADLHTNALQGISCSLHPRHFNIRQGYLVFLRPLGKQDFQVRLDYQRGTTSLGRYREGEWGHHSELELEELVGWEDLTEDRIRLWLLMS